MEVPSLTTPWGASTTKLNSYDETCGWGGGEQMGRGVGVDGSRGGGATKQLCHDGEAQGDANRWHGGKQAWIPISAQMHVVGSSTWGVPRIGW